MSNPDKSSPPFDFRANPKIDAPIHSPLKASSVLSSRPTRRVGSVVREVDLRVRALREANIQQSRDFSLDDPSAPNCRRPTQPSTPVSSSIASRTERVARRPRMGVIDPLSIRPGIGIHPNDEENETLPDIPPIQFRIDVEPTTSYAIDSDDEAPKPKRYDLKAWNALYKKRAAKLKGFIGRASAEVSELRVKISEISVVLDALRQRREGARLERERLTNEQDQSESERSRILATKTAEVTVLRRALVDVETENAKILRRAEDEFRRLKEQKTLKTEMVENQFRHDLEMVEDTSKQEIEMLKDDVTELKRKHSELEESRDRMLRENSRRREIEITMTPRNEEIRGEIAREKTARADEVSLLEEELQSKLNLIESERERALGRLRESLERKVKLFEDEKRAEKLRLNEERASQTAELKSELSEVRREREKEISRVTEELRRVAADCRAELDARLKKQTDENASILSSLKQTNAEALAQLQARKEALERTEQARSDQVKAKMDATFLALKQETDALKLSLNAQLRKLREENAAAIKVIQEEKEAARRERTETLDRKRAKFKNEIDSLQAEIEVAESEARGEEESIERLKRELVSGSASLQRMTQLRIEEDHHRRALHNENMNLRGSIRVFCRVRPLLPPEMSAEPVTTPDQLTPPHLVFVDPSRLVLVEQNATDLAGRSRDGRRYPFNFDRVFPPVATQDQVFQEISLLVQSALDGFKVCIFAYGQTGSGKTYTMEGLNRSHLKDADARGMIPRSVNKIFEHVDFMKAKGWSFTIHVSFLEIYMKNLRDLLVGGSPSNRKRGPVVVETSDSTRVQNLKTIEVKDPQRVSQLLAIAQKHRATASTQSNDQSSRSHSIFTLDIVSHHCTGAKHNGTLHLIDLAGSERVGGMGAEGLRRAEGQMINLDLLSLGAVLRALKAKKRHIPYRDSTLCRVLKSSLGANQAKVLMFCNVSPVSSHFQESKNALEFAQGVNGTQIGSAKRQRQ